MSDDECDKLSLWKEMSLEVDKPVKVEVEAVPKLIELEELMKRIGVSHKHLLYVIGAANLAAVANFLPPLQSQPAWPTSASLPIVSCLFRIAGYLFLAPLADVVGRRPIVMGSVVICVVTSAATVFLPRDSSMILCILLCNFFISGWDINCNLLQLESVDQAQSLMPISLVEFGACLFSFIVWWTVLIFGLTLSDARPLSLGIAILFLLSLAPLSIVRAESPKLLFARNKGDAAVRAVARLHSKKAVAKVMEQEDAQLAVCQKPPTYCHGSFTSQFRGHLLDWFGFCSPTRRRLRHLRQSLCLLLCYVIVQCVKFSVQDFIGRFLPHGETPKARVWENIISEFGGIPGALLAIVIARRKKPGHVWKHDRDLASFTVMLNLAACVAIAVFSRHTTPLLPTLPSTDVTKALTGMILLVFITATDITTFVFLANRVSVRFRASTLAVAGALSLAGWIVAYNFQTELPRDMLPLIWALAWSAVMLLLPMIDGSNPDD